LYCFYHLTYNASNSHLVFRRIKQII